MIKVEANDAEVLRVFGRVVSAVKQPQPLLAAIGEVLIDSTKQRFQTGTGPDGTRWPDNSPVTLLEYLRRFDGIHEKTGKRIGTKDGYYIKRGADAGRLTKKSAAMLAAKRPLIGETRLLSHIIGYKVAGHSVQVGTPFLYGAMLQFGGKKSQFPNLWGDIPARPFLGISAYDRDSILEQVRQFVELK